MKQFCCLIFCLLLCATGVFAGNGQEHHWFFKPVNDARPAMPPSGVPALPESVVFLGADEKKVYLTFDAGYVNEHVLRITQTLIDEGVPAAFFILKQLVREQVPLLQQWNEAGFLTCNHTLTHPNIARIDAQALRDEITGLATMYREATGQEMGRFFRPPEGAYSIDALKTVEELGYRTVFWSAAYADWDNAHQMEENAALDLLLKRTHNGAILLLHPTSATNAAILPRYLKTLRAAGYTFGSLEDFA